jgi:hypothetical protein
LYLWETHPPEKLAQDFRKRFFSPFLAKRAQIRERQWALSGLIGHCAALDVNLATMVRMLVADHGLPLDCTSSS